MENEELIKILTLIEQQVITAEQGYQLMDSIKKYKEKKNHSQGRFLNIDIDQQMEKGSMIMLRIPIPLAKSILKIDFIKQEISKHTRIDIEQILSFIEEKVRGDLIKVQTEEEKTRVWIE